MMKWGEQEEYGRVVSGFRADSGHAAANLGASGFTSPAEVRRTIDAMPSG